MSGDYFVILKQGGAHFKSKFLWIGKLIFDFDISVNKV